MFTYSTNWMGPISERWYTKRGISSTDEQWCGGRIDIYGPYEAIGEGIEYSLPVMDEESWGKLSLWLGDYCTDVLVSFEKIIHDFHAETDHKIVWASEKFKE